MTPTTNPQTEEVAMSSFSHIPHGCLSEGTVTPLGVIEQVSLTAYRIGAQWVPFHKIHGAYTPAEPLVVLG